MAPFRSVLRQGRRGLLRFICQQQHHHQLQQRGFCEIRQPVRLFTPNRDALVVAGTELRFAVPPAARNRLLSPAAAQQRFFLASLSSSAAPGSGGRGEAAANGTGSGVHEIKVGNTTSSGSAGQASPGDAPPAPGTDAAAGTGAGAGMPSPAGTAVTATPSTGLAAHSEGAPTPPARVPTAMRDLTEKQKENRIRELENELEKADLLLLKKDNIIRELQQSIVRVVADAQDLIDRVRREAEMEKKYAIQNFAKDLTEVADNFSRALASVPEEYSRPDKLPADPQGCLNALRKLLEGVYMTKQQLEKVFENHGLKKFVPLGEQFDPNFHEAVSVINDPTKPPGVIIEVFKPGYMLHDRVIRPAQVGVVMIRDAT